MSKLKEIIYSFGAVALLMGATSCDDGQELDSSREFEKIEDAGVAYDSTEQGEVPNLDIGDLPGELTVCWRDEDGDDYPAKGKQIRTRYECPEGTAEAECTDHPSCFDCDDSDERINPGAQEICNGIDDDCDGVIDGNLTRQCHSICGEGLEYCIDGDYQDCDARVPSDEVCDGIDNDCDGETDEGLFELFFRDHDQDGYGNPNDTIEACQCPDGYTQDNTDCDDDNPFAHEYITCIHDENRCGSFQLCIDPCPPPPEEICDGIDNDCNGLIDEIECCEEGDVRDVVECPPSPQSFVFVIDNSGSMRERSDPNYVRYAGLRGFVELMDDEDEAAIIAFTNNMQVYCGNFSSDRDALMDCITQARQFSLGGSTDIDPPMYQAIDIVSGRNNRKIIILLTDGVDANGDYDADNIRITAENRRATIYALGFGEADEEALRQTITADGSYSLINNAEEIPGLYEQIFQHSNYESWRECDRNGMWIERQGECE